MKAAIERVKKKLGIPEGEPWEFNEAEAAAFFEKRPDIVAQVDNGDIVTMEVQEPRWVNDEEAAKIRADIATATDNQVINPGAVDFSRKMEPGVYTDQGFTPGGSPAGTYTDDAIQQAVEDVDLRITVDNRERPAEVIAELTPQQKRAATLAAKKAAKEAQNNG
jgi:hypothetical protein